MALKVAYTCFAINTLLTVYTGYNHDTSGMFFSAGFAILWAMIIYFGKLDETDTKQ